MSYKRARRSILYDLFQTFSKADKFKVRDNLRRLKGDQLLFLFDLYKNLDDVFVIREKWKLAHPNTKIVTIGSKLLDRILILLVNPIKNPDQTYIQGVIAFYIERGLFKIALQTLKKARQKAEDLENFTLLVQLIRDEREILIEYFQSEDNQQYIKNLNQAEIEIQRKAENLVLYGKIFSKLRSGIELNPPEEIFANNIGACMSTKAKLFFFRIGIKKARLEGDNEKFIEQMKLAESLVTANPYLLSFKEIAIFQKKLISALAILYIETGDWEKSRPYLEKMEKAHQGNKKIEALGRFWVAQLYYLEVSGKHTELESLLESIDSQFEELKNGFDPETRIRLLTMVAVAFFKLGKYKESRLWAEQLFNISSLNYLPLSIIFGKIFYPITLFHTGQIFLENPLRRAFYFLKNNNGLNGYTDIVLSILKKLNTEPNPEKVFLDLELPQKKTDHFEIMTCFFNLEVWVKSFLTSTSMMALELKARQ